MPARLRKGERSVILCVRVPISYAAWLRAEGGRRRGAVSKVIRRLIKEEAWRREGKYVQLRYKKAAAAEVVMRSVVPQRRLKTLPRRRFGRPRKRAAATTTAVATTATTEAVEAAE